MKYKSSQKQISLPKVLSEALESPCFDVEYVGHSINGKPAGKLDLLLKNGEYAFFVGKIFKDNSGIYTEEFLKGVIAFTRQNIDKNGRIKIVLCQVLSELFNGESDLDGVRNFDEGKKFIEKLAKSEFGLKPERLEIVDLEKIPEHQELFALLRTADKRGVSLDTAFAEEENPPMGSSVYLAKILYFASQKSELFQQILQSTIPPKLRNENSGDLAKKRNYAVVEIAIRLAEILRGCTIHGGIDRQGVYDEIIEKIVKGSAVILREIPELAEICQQLKGVKFETLHLAADKNPYEVVKSKGQAIRKIASIIALAVSGAIGMVQYGQYREQQAEAARQEQKEIQIKETINDKLKGVIMGHEFIDNFIYGIKDEAQREAFFKLTEIKDEKLTRKVVLSERDFEQELGIYTNLPKGYIENVLRPFIIDFFLANRDFLDRRIRGFDSEGAVNNAFVLKFLSDHHLLLVQTGHDNWLLGHEMFDQRQLIPLLPYQTDFRRNLQYEYLNRCEEVIEVSKYNEKPLGVIYFDGNEVAVADVNGVVLARERNSKTYSKALTQKLISFLLR